MAANGQKLRVAVTKTSAQGKSVQSATPNLMSFSTDENSIWFNGKKYGAYKLNYKLYELSGGSLNQSDIINALDGFTQEHWDLVSEGGIGYMVSPSEGIASTTLCSLRAWVDSSYKYLSIVIYGVEGIMYLLFYYNNSSSTYEGTVVLDRSYIGRDEIVNNLTSTNTDKPLSAAMGKKLQDEKLSKTDVVNNLTSTDTTKALSAAQGKKLNDQISNIKIKIFESLSSKTEGEDVTDIVGKLTDDWNLHPEEYIFYIRDDSELCIAPCTVYYEAEMRYLSYQVNGTIYEYDCEYTGDICNLVGIYTFHATPD